MLSLAFAFVCRFSWFYTPSLNLWALVTGGPTKLAFTFSNYGVFRVPSASNIMPARQAHGMAIDRIASKIYFVAGLEDVALADMYVGEEERP
jgi:hypothetical protein